MPDAESIVSRFNAQLRDMIADRTYHRLLHVDWIQADINGDGVPECVPRTDQTGAVGAAAQLLAVFDAAPKSRGRRRRPRPGFYVGGTIYSDWASVPSRFKSNFTQDPDSRRSSASIFRFTW